MKAHKLKPLVLAVGFAVQALAQQSFAQEEVAPVEEVLVTGFRASVMKALDAKREASGSVDSIIAEDIADFPDNNLAESMQRIPGVAITRVGGEGRNISVRGLGPGYTRVRVNGMEAISTGGGTDAAGGANRGRGFDFNTFSSDLFNSLTVRKTASADVEEGSLGATVDLRAARPFDYKGLKFTAGAQAGYNDLSESVDPKFSAMASNTFGDFGALVSVSYSERDISDLGASTVRWQNGSQYAACTVANCNLWIDGDSNEVKNTKPNPFTPRLPRYDSYAHEQSRLGVSAAFQYQPSDDTEVNLDILYSNNDATRNEVFMQTVFNSASQIRAMTVTDYAIDDTNTMTYGKFTNATVRAENRYDELNTEFTQLGLSGKHTFGDNLTLSGLLGHANSVFENPIQTTVVMQKSGLDFTYDYRGDLRENPYLSWGDDASNDPLKQLNAVQGWTTNSVRKRPLGAENTFDVAQGDIEFTLNDSLTLKSGLHYKNFQFESSEERMASETANGIVIDANNTRLFDANIGPQGTWLIPDLDAIAAQYNLYGDEKFATSINNRLADNYTAEEATIGLYAQLVFDTQINDTPVRGDVGFRYIDTDQESSGYVEFTENGQKTFIKQPAKYSYDEILPSMNIVFEPIENVLLRAAYSQTIARAGLSSITPGSSISVSGGNKTVTTGNPQLEPTKSTNYDLAAEVYFEGEGAISFAVFKKEVDSFVQTFKESKPFTESGLDPSAAVAACGDLPDCSPASPDWSFSVPINSPGGNLYGFEANYQQPFSFLPGALANFGVITNFTYVKSQLNYTDTSGKVVATRDLTGLSESTRSATLYYEQDEFSARISTVSRSGYLTDAIGRNNNTTEGTNGTTNVDAAFSYNINDNWKLTLDALNLTEEVDDQWVDEQGNRLSYYHETGRQFYFGVKYQY